MPLLVKLRDKIKPTTARQKATATTETIARIAIKPRGGGVVKNSIDIAISMAEDSLCLANKLDDYSFGNYVCICKLQ